MSLAAPESGEAPPAARATPFGALARALHRLDFDVLLPWLGRLPRPLGEALGAVRAAAMARAGADWRSLALGQRHIGPRTWQALAELAPDASLAQRCEWLRQRFAAETRDELEARWLPDTRVDALACRFVPPRAPRWLLEQAPDVARSGAVTAAGGVLRDAQAAPGAAMAPPRGLVLLTAHHESFILGIAFLARSGARIHALKSAVTHDPRVLPAVGRHFELKYVGLEARLNGGRLIDIEAGVRPFYRALEDGDTVIVLADAPALAQGARVELPFLGARRALAGGAARMAGKTGSDIAAFTCRRDGPGRYTVAMSAPRPAAEAGAVEAAYDFLSQAIQATPGGWWAADLLPAMPPLAEAPASADPPVAAAAAESAHAAEATATAAAPAPARRRSPTARHCAVLLCTASPLQGSQELAFGHAQLRRTLGEDPTIVAWGELGNPGTCGEQGKGSAGAEPDAPGLPATVQAAVEAGADLLVLAHPALLATAGLPGALGEAIDAAGAGGACAIATTQHRAGAPAPAYVTLADFEAYVAQRATLPATAPWEPAATGVTAAQAATATPVAAYRLTAAAARARMAKAQAQAQAQARAGAATAIDWRTPPPGVRTVAAPRAYVHDWSDYRRHERRDMLALLPAGAQRLLDIGGGEGAFARLAERERGLQAWLLEPDATAAAAARAQGLRVLACRLEDAPGAPQDSGNGNGSDSPPASPAHAPSTDPTALPAGGFDVVTMLDVLEHLADPVAALRAVRRWLAPGGALIVSTPNLGHWPLVRDLAAGRFDRLPVGTLCCTHLHFFTPATLRQTLDEAGFALEHETLAGADEPLPSAAAEAGLRAWIDAATAAGVALDRRSLRTETLRARARLHGGAAAAPGTLPPGDDDAAAP